MPEHESNSYADSSQPSEYGVPALGPVRPEADLRNQGASESLTSLGEDEFWQAIARIVASQRDLAAKPGSAFSRRRGFQYLLLGAGALGFAASGIRTGLAVSDYLQEQASKAARSISTVLDEETAAIGDDDDIEAEFLQQGEHFVDLDHEQKLVDEEGEPIELLVVALGTSWQFAIGWDGGGQHDTTLRSDQPRATIQMARVALGEAGMQMAGISKYDTSAMARLGSYGGRGNFPGTNEGAGDAQIGPHQLLHPDLQRMLRTTRAKVRVIVGDGYDDYRGLFSDANQMLGDVNAAIRLVGSRTVSEDASLRTREFLGRGKAIAVDVGQHTFMVAGILNEINNERVANGLMRLTVQVNLWWDFGDQLLPLALINGGTDDPQLRRWMRLDVFGPEDQERYAFDPTRLPNGLGTKVNRLGWGYIARQAAPTVARIRREYPELHVVTKSLLHVNERPNFYLMRARFGPNAGKLDQRGNGHSGLDISSPAFIAGAHYLAAEDLSVSRRQTRNGAVFLDELAPALKSDDSTG